MGNKLLTRDAFANGAKNEKDPVLAKLRDLYRSPKTLLESLATFWLKRPFDFDFAASESNAIAPKFFTERDDALSQIWVARNGWCNPPYSIAEKFLAHAWRQEKLNQVTFLINAITETVGWHRYVQPSEPGRFTARYVKFGEYAGLSTLWHNETKTRGPSRVECILLKKRFCFTNPELHAYKLALWEKGLLPKQKKPRDGNAPVDGESAPKGSALVTYSW